MKFAIIETGGKQYKVISGQKLKIEKLDGEAGSTIALDKVLLEGDSESNGVKIGAPYIENAKVEAKVLKQARSRKVMVFRYHSKTRYRKTKGHRQHFTEIEITKV